MTDNPLKHELLKQNGHSALDEEVSRLHAIIDAEGRRVRRLMWWTIAVWALWFLVISAGLIVPYAAAHANVPPGPATQPATQTVASRHSPGTGEAVIAGAIGVLLFAGFLGLPVAGVVLAIILIVSRRTASSNQIRASLAAIDAQLRMLGDGKGTGV